MTIKERINEIKSLTQDQCWYITKQPLSFKELCYAAKIVEEYQSGNSSLNFADYFNTIKSIEYGISSNHRMTNNCYYIGLLEKNGSEYKDSILTEIYYEIKNRCNSNFEDEDSYFDILINQIEKVYLTNDVDRAKETIRKNININPAFFLYKVLICLGDTTGDYSISLSEFYKFVGTSFNYQYYLSTTELIIESRKNTILENDLSYIDNFYDDLRNIDNTNFSNNRLHLLLGNLPYFNISTSKISLELKYLKELKYKLYEYESNYNDDQFTIKYLTTFSNKTKRILNNFNVKNKNIIYYGAPGTGKSYKVDKIIENLDSHFYERITFHPEYDNASFIGGYKPISDKDSAGNEIIKYQFVPQAFTNIYERAWQDLDNQYYLVIEEINRGNCAEIFGEIFQLLDRTSNYTVSPTKELKEYLIDVAFKDENHLGVVNGLKLPPNLSILATMNTSDQSLFPMDSAFKRRWDWEYIPICYNPIDDFKKKNDSFDFEIDIEDGKKYSWIKFIEKVNLNHIKNNPSLGMDKCIGNYFIKPDNGNVISLKPFVNKVIFYLWNDVFKDEDNKVFEENTSYEDFFPIETNGKKKIKELFDRIDLKAIPSLEIVEDENPLGQVAESTEEMES